MNKFLRASARITFGASLAVSWLGITSLIGIVAWQGERTTWALVNWAALWFFAVAAPTIQASIVQRRLNDLSSACPNAPERIRRDLAHARSSMLMFTTMAVLIAFALGLGER